MFSCSNNSNTKEQISKIEDKTEVSNNIKKLDDELIIGERIDGPANIRDSINGEIILSLNDNVLIETTPTLNNWLGIGIDVKLNKQQLNDFKIFPNENLITSNGEIIGQTIDTVDIYMTNEEDGYGSIGGYTHSENIKSNTFPENILNQLLKQGKTKMIDYKSFIRSFKFQNDIFEDLPNLTQYYIYESSVVDLSPQDRITLLFNKNDELVGIIHSRNINTENYKTYPLILGHKLTITSDINSNEVKRLIKRRIKFYNSVD